MLLLVTIGLVLVAAVTLVIGFVSNTLAPIVVSIICSFSAAVVLTIFYRMNRGRRAAPAGGQPSPLVDTTPPVFSRAGTAAAPPSPSARVVTGPGASPPSSFAPPAQYAEPPASGDDRPRFAEPPVAVDRPTRQFRRVPAQAATAPPEDAPAPSPTTEMPVARARPEPLAVAETPGPSGPDAPAAAPPEAVAAGAWDDDLPFPIEDYDDLRAVEILPLLPELDDDELGEIRTYEQAHRNRLAIIGRIDALVAESAPEPEPEAAAEAQGSAVPDDGLPIAEYDFLGVSEILPLLGELDEDELQSIRSHEEAGRRRATILYRIDALLGAPEADETAAPPDGGETGPEAEAEYPIAEYDKLRVFQILLLLPELDEDELHAVRAYEQAGRGRVTILNQIDARLADASAAPPPPHQVVTTPAEAPAATAPEPESAAEPPAATASAPSATAAEPAPAPEPPAPAPAPAPPAEPEAQASEPGPVPAVAAPPGWLDLPIADYEELSQGDILPLLDELDDDELVEIRDFEDANRARVAILYRINALLAPLEPEDEPEADADELPVAAAESASAPAADEEPDWPELPIADYDLLAQGDILPLLDELDDDELDNVRDYEEAHRARVAILYRIDALMVVPDEPEEDEELEEAEEAEDEGDVSDESPTAKPEAEGIDAAALPIAEYDTLTVREILPLLAELDDDELDEVRDYEEAHDSRDSILMRIDALLEPYEDAEPDGEFEDEEDQEEPAPAPVAPPAAASPPVASAPAPVAEEPEADDEAFEEGEEGEEYEDEEEEEAPAAGEDDFPIADYDDLRVAEILPLLSQLQPDELELVARHEEQLANRSTILNRIQRLLRMSAKNAPS